VFTVGSPDAECPQRELNVQRIADRVVTRLAEPSSDAFVAELVATLAAPWERLAR
jgi:hypothetical protein